MSANQTLHPTRAIAHLAEALQDCRTRGIALETEAMLGLFALVESEGIETIGSQVLQ